MIKSLEILSKHEGRIFPEEGAYDYVSNYGSGYCFPKDGTLYVPVIMASDPGKGHGTQLLGQLENLVKSQPKLNKIAFPGIINPILRRMVIKRRYKCKFEFFKEMDENIEVWFKEMDGDSE
jgi:hypothetical protein